VHQLYSLHVTRDCGEMRDIMHNAELNTALFFNLVFDPLIGTVHHSSRAVSTISWYKHENYFFVTVYMYIDVHTFYCY